MPHPPIVVLRHRARLSIGLTGRWTIAALAAFIVYRSVPYQPEADIVSTVLQQIRFDYSSSRTLEMKTRAMRKEGDALLAAADDVLNSRVELDSIEARGPVLPSPFPRRMVVRVNYRIVKDGQQLESKERYLEFRKGAMDEWHFQREWGTALYWLYPL
jgi:hypothetical protein